MNNNKKLIILLVFYYKWLARKMQKIDLYELKSLARYSIIRMIVNTLRAGEADCVFNTVNLGTSASSP